MSVQYKLNKEVRIGDLKKIGLKVEDLREKLNSHPFVVTNDNYSGVAISKATMDGDDVDKWIIDEFEGRFSHGGVGVMLEICDKLDCMFITDEDIDNLFYTNQNEITEEMFKNRTEDFRKNLKGNQ